MIRSPEKWRIFSRPGRKGFLVSAAIFLFLFLPLTWSASLWYEGMLIRGRKAQETARLNLHGNALTAAINKRFALLEGLWAFALANPEPAALKARFDTFAAALHDVTTGIRNLALAPGGVVRLIYPLAGNEKALGHDLVNDPHPQIGEAAKRAIITRETTVGGPYELRQGGMGLVARKAVFVNGTFWGLATMVIDIDPILEEAGLNTRGGDLVMALRDSSGRPFFGEGGVFDRDPVSLPVWLPEGYWELGGVPPGGWRGAVRRSYPLFRSGGLIIAFLLSVIGALIINRQTHLTQEVGKRTADLTLANERLNREIEEHRRAEETLRESEERFRVVASNTPDHLFVQDSELRYLLVVNPQLGLTEQDMIGRTDYDFLQKEEADKLTTTKRQVMETGKPLHFETSLVSKAGTPEFFDGTYVPRLDARGRVDGLIGYFRNVTEFKKTEQMLQRNEQVLRLFVEYSPAAIAMFDRDMKYIVASRRYLADYNLAEQNLVGRSHYDVYPEIPERWREIHRRCLAGAIERCDEDPFPRADGRLDWVRWEIRPWYEKAGEIGGVILFSEVITERKKVEMELKRHREHLEKLVKERTAELESKIAEIERMNRLFVGRELRMAELKERIRELEAKIGARGGRQGD